MRIPHIVLLLVLLNLSACASWSVSSLDKSNTRGETENTRAAKTPESVLITEGDLTRHYISLGDISVTVNKTSIFNADPTREMVNHKLQEEAAKIGADAVILVRYGTVGVSVMSWGSLDGKGRAVVYK